MAARGKTDRKRSRAARGAARASEPRARTAGLGPPRLVLVALLVFASGCASLVLQVAWMRELRLIFGATTASVAAVLSVFMGGLGLGSAVLGKRADRVANPLLLYGVLEAAIAITAAATPWLISLVSVVYLGLGGQQALGLTGASGVRLLLSAAVLAVPTFLMGGTLPAAVRAAMARGDAHRTALGALYGANTLGAVLGAAMATFFWLEFLGTRATLWTGCALGLLAGSVAIAWSRRGAHGAQERGIGASDSVAAPERAPDAAAPELPAALVYFIAGVLGFTFFALEIVWYRMLAPILGGTAFTFGLILSLALAGIGIGGLAYPLLFRRFRPTWSALAFTCACAAAATILPYALGDRLALLAASGVQSATSFGGLVAAWSVVAGITVMPMAILSGIQFPLLIALLGHGPRDVSDHLGKTYAWNTLGAIAGSLVAGFGALPLLSAPGMWRGIALLLALLSVGILVAARVRTGRAIGGMLIGGVLAVAAATIGGVFLAGPTAAWRHGGIGAGRAVVPLEDANLTQAWLHAARHATIWEADGIESSVAINRGDGLSFVVSGKNDGNALGDAATQIGISVLGAVLHEDPKTALVIGLGTGESAGWLADMRGIEEVDVVELEPAIDEMARRTADLNREVLRHPRVRRIYNDGREFVLSTDRKYDLIISEPSNPYRAGIAALYTTEFYEAVRDRLNPGGIFVQWLQAYEVDDSAINTVLATIGSAFAHVEVWQTLPGDLQLVCTVETPTYTPDKLRARIAEGAAREALAAAWAVYDLEGFLAHFAVNEKWAQSAARIEFLPRNTDDRTTLEYSFAKTVGRATPFSIEQTRGHLQESDFHLPAFASDTSAANTAERESIDWDLVELRRQEFNLLFDGELSLAMLASAADRQLVEAFDRYRRGDHRGAIDHWPEEHREPESAIARLVLARCYAETGREESLALADAIEEHFSADAAAVRATYALRVGQAAESADHFEEYFGILRKTPWTRSTERVLSQALELARANPELAGRLYELLAEPLASWRFESSRQLTRVRLAMLLDAQRVADSLAIFEPHVPWEADILEARADAYVELNHPLADVAARDWRRYQENVRK